MVKFTSTLYFDARQGMRRERNGGVSNPSVRAMEAMVRLSASELDREGADRDRQPLELTMQGDGQNLCSSRS